MGNIGKTESKIRNHSALCSFKEAKELTTDYSIAKFFDANKDQIDEKLVERVCTPRTWNRLSKGQFTNESFDGRSKSRWNDLSNVIGEKPNQIYQYGPYDWWGALFGDKNTLENLFYHHQSTVKCFLDLGNSENHQANLGSASQRDLKACEQFFTEYIDSHLVEFENDDRAAFIFSKLISVYRLHHWFTSYRFPALNSCYISLFKLV